MPTGQSWCVADAPYETEGQSWCVADAPYEIFAWVFLDTGQDRRRFGRLLQSPPLVLAPSCSLTEDPNMSYIHLTKLFTRSVLVVLFLSLGSFATADEIPVEVLRKAAHVTPSPKQLAWQELEFVCFAHFGVNTFTGKEWGDGTEDPNVFNPTQFDARQWVQTCKDAGLKMLIITAKHHDGFCLWPSKYTEHSVKNSTWRGGKGDVVREVADACHESGVKFAFYLSPWDRHEKTYGTDAYNDYFKKQLTELLTQYGEVAEVWFDGACGEGPNGKRQKYDMPGYFEVVRKHQPNAVIAIMGPDVRWVGNENGLARKSEWSVIAKPYKNTAKDLGDRKYLVDENGNAKKLIWYPAECDVSIRPGWFYHAEEDDKVKSLAHLLKIHYYSVGRNSLLLLNIPPDRRGLFHENDVARLHEFRRALDGTYANNLAQNKAAKADTQADADHDAAKALDGHGDTHWTTPEGVTTGTLEVDLGSPTTFDRAMLQEQIAEGQRVEKFVLDAMRDGQWKLIGKATTIGYKRLLRFPTVTAQKVRLRIIQSRDCPTIREFGLYKASPEEVAAK